MVGIISKRAMADTNYPGTQMSKDPTLVLQNFNKYTTKSKQNGKTKENIKQGFRNFSSISTAFGFEIFG